LRRPDVMRRRVGVVFVPPILAHSARTLPGALEATVWARLATLAQMDDEERRAWLPRRIEVEARACVNADYERRQML
jgi:hypothetical protein